MKFRGIPWNQDVVFESQFEEVRENLNFSFRLGKAHNFSTSSKWKGIK